MSGAATIIDDDRLLGYDFGPGHPMSPVRLDLTFRLARALGVLTARDGLTLTAAPVATDAELARVHDPGYVAAVRAAGAEGGRADLAHGLGTPDDPVFPGMHEAAARIAGASLRAARDVATGTALHAANVAGGLHHAMPAAASGFCVYNDAALAVAALRDAGAARVAYVDLDVHHGDGVQAMFYDDPTVLTISLHETPRRLFPFVSGDPSETGGPAAPGSAANVALPPGTGDAGWLRAFHAVVPHLLAEFAPDALVTQHGCDSHALDPLADLTLSVDAQRAAALACHELAHEHCGGRWVALGGGGYAVVDVVPRAWTHLLAIVAGRPVPVQTPTPAEWRQYVWERCGVRAPRAMGDDGQLDYADWADGYDPAAELDRAIRAARNAVFPEHGLDPRH